MDYRELINLGLSEKESKVYLASLEIGKSIVQNISKKSKVNRATTYVIIESLTEKGLMSSYTEEKKQFFYAESPEKLSLLFREQAMAIQRKHEFLDGILPELKALRSTQNKKPTVRYFEGKNGLMAMEKEFHIDNNEKESRMLYSYDLLDNVFSKKERELMREKRINKKIKVKSIINAKNIASGELTNRRRRVSTKKYPITCDIAFFENKVRIAIQKGNLGGLIIENKEISNTLKTLFDLAWRHLEDKKNKA